MFILYLFRSEKKNKREIKKIIFMEKKIRKCKVLGNKYFLLLIFLMHKDYAKKVEEVMI